MPTDAIGRFVSGSNISRFVDQLRIETNHARRQMLRRLLIEEENRFGVMEERLAMIERHISDGAACIARQTEIVARLKRDGDECATAEGALETSKMIQALFEGFRATHCKLSERVQL
jgi:hypothetical protein